MFYRDLTPYEYGDCGSSMLVGTDSYETDSGTRLHDRRGLRCLNVGWLAKGHEFLIGDTTDELHERLFRLIQHRVNLMRGFEYCPFCEDPPRVQVVSADGTRRRLRRDRPRARRGGQEVWMGNGEIRVQGADGVLYAAPTLVYHYVVEHRYLPPAEFIEAVMASPIPWIPEGTVPFWEWSEREWAKRAAGEPG